MIPFDNEPLALETPRYTKDGLILCLDSLQPRRDGSIPGSTKIWEDLSDNHYDCTFNNNITLSGEPLSFINCWGHNSSFPKSQLYTVELIAKHYTSYTNQNCFYIYGSGKLDSMGCSANPRWPYVYGQGNKNIVRGNNTANIWKIYLGQTKETSKYNHTFNFSSWNDDGFMVRSRRQNNQ